MDDKQKNVLKITAIIAAVAVIGFFIYQNYKKEKVLSPEEKEKQQLQEIALLKEQAGFNPPTEEEMEQQLREIAELKNQAGL